MPKATPIHHRLWRALEANNLEALNSALAEGANPNSAAGEWVPLGKALRRCSPELALALIDAGADIHGDDARNSLLELAASSDGQLSVLERMLSRGVCATNEALTHAARTQSAKCVELLISHGAPALGKVQRGDYPPINWWVMRGKNPVPEVLMEATFQSPVLVDHATQIAQECSKAQNIQVLEWIENSPQFPVEALTELLVGSIQSGWEQGVDRLLSKRLVPIHCRPTGDTPVLVAAYRSSLRRKKAFAGDLMKRLIEYGFDLSQSCWRYARIGQGEHTLRPEPVFLRLVEETDKVGRRKFLGRMLGWGAPIHCRRGNGPDPEGGGGLVHLLLEKGDPGNAFWILGKTQVNSWQKSKDPGLACSLLSRSIDETTPAWLEKLAQAGADLSRPNEYGQGPWELILDQIDQNKPFGVRPKPTSDHVREVAETLARLGCDPSEIDTSGTTATDRMIGMHLDAGWVSSLAALNLQGRTAPATEVRARPRL